MRTRIEQAALRCVERWGIAKTGLGDIAKEAGCARQTVYNHFPDAESVISAALFDASEVFVERLRVAIRGVDEPGDRILEAMRFCLANLPEEPLLKLVLAPEVAPFANVSVFRSGPVWERLRSIAAECLAPDRTLAPHTDELAEMMTRILLSLLVVEGPAERNEVETRAWLARWLLAPIGLAPSRASTRRGRAGGGRRSRTTVARR